MINGETPEKGAGARRAILGRLTAVMPSVLALGALVLSISISVRQGASTDLRSREVLLIDAMAGSAYMLVSAAVSGKLARDNIWPCVTYGAWAASVFRLVPPIMNESVLFDRSLDSADALYVLFGAAVHGGIVALLAIPYARRIFSEEWASGEEYSSIQAACGTVVTYFVIAAVIRMAVEFHK